MAYLGLNPNEQLLNTSTETFSGDNATLQFTLARAVASASDLDVMIGSTLQRPFADYSAGNLTLLFVSPPASGTNNITVTYRGGALNSLDLTATVFNAGTVGAPSVVSLAANNTGFYWANATTMVATVAGANRAKFNGTAASTSETTGALTVQGGIGVAGNINGTGIIKTTNATESFAVSSGALQVAGGAGIVGNLNIGGDITCVGDFTVNGTFTTTGTDSLDVTDPFVFLANANPGDTYDTGIVSQYNDGATTRYTGYFRDITDAKYKLFTNLTVKPTTTVDTTDPSFQYTDLILANLSATGNVTGTYVIGNGSLLTGISTDVSKIFNGASNVSIPGINGNIVHNVNGVTIANVTSSGMVVTGSISASTTISAAGNITAGNIQTAGLISATSNIVSAGNVSGGNVVTGGAVSAFSDVTGANFNTGGLVTATGNITGGNVRTAGLASVGGNVQAGNLRTTGTISAAGDVYANNYIGVSTVSALGGIQGGNLISDSTIAANGDITSSAGALSVFGNATAANFITTGAYSTTGNINGANLNITGGISDTNALTISTVTGNITLTPATGSNVQITSNANITSTTISTSTTSGSFRTAGGIGVAGNAYIGGLVNVTGNIDGGNLRTAGLISSTGTITGANITGANILTAGLMSATGNITGGNLQTAGLATVTGNIIGGNIITGGAVSATGAISATANVIGGNIITSAAVSAGGVISATGNVTGGNINTGGLVTATGNIISTANVSGGNLIATTLIIGATLSATSNVYATSNVIATGTLIGASLSLTGNVLGQIATTGNITGGNLIATTAVSAAGNIVTGTGNISAGNAIISTLVQSTTLSASGNVIAGNVRTNGLISATGQITGSQFNGSGAGLTSIPGGNVSGTVPTATTAATVTSNAQANITSVGTLTSLAIQPAGTIISSVPMTITQTWNNVSATFTAFRTSITSTAAATNSRFIDLMDDGATVAFIGLNGEINTTGLITTTGNVTGANITTGGLITATGNITGGNISATNHTGTSVSVTGNISAGNVIATHYGSGAGLTAIPAGNLSGTTLNSGVVTTSITTVGVLNSGSITSGFGAIDIGTDTVTCGGVVNANGNGVGNIGSSSLYFNTVFAKATSAQYADLAECYLADADYPPGTVVSFGGTQEVTLSNVDNDRRIAGVVSTNPSYIMNSSLTGDHVTVVALTGRVPTRVLGPVSKGDMMVSAGYGLARSEADPLPGTVIGKALANFSGNEGVIEVVVGKI